jgi:hypothetical protein
MALPLPRGLFSKVCYCYITGPVKFKLIYYFDELPNIEYFVLSFNRRVSPSQSQTLSIHERQDLTRTTANMSLTLRHAHSNYLTINTTP